MVGKEHPPQLKSVMDQSEFNNIVSSHNKLPHISAVAYIPLPVINLLLAISILLLNLLDANPVATLSILVPLLALDVTYLSFIIFLCIKNRMAKSAFVKRINNEYRHRNISFTIGYVLNRFSMFYYESLTQAGNIQPTTPTYPNEKFPLLQNV